ncbi:MAG: acyl-CoA thioesterase [Alphaproteobacteria bacterium]|nr:acyl-CoA thioesterase [Alphaproteobacteria bacterium]
MLGHVNNAVYQQWLEWGRFEWVRAAGTDFAALSDADLTLVVVHVSLDYRREARLDDALVIETVLARIGGRSVTYRQRVVHADGAVACDGTVVLAVFDKVARASAPLPDDVRAALTPFVAAFDASGDEPAGA